MAYTRSWSSSTPLGSRAAGEIDDAIREKMLDLEERLESILATGTDLDDDPLVLNPSRIGSDPATPIERYIIVPPYVTVGSDSSQSYDHQNGYNECGEWSGAVVVPVGYKIILFEAFLNKNGGASVHARLRGHNMGTGTQVLDTGEIATSASGIQLVASAALDYTVTDLDHFRISGAGGAFFTGARFYGARITVEIPNYGFGY